MKTMLEVLKKQVFKIFQCLIYIILLCLIYGIWSYKAWELWYVTLIIVLAIVGLGVFVSYLWIKSVIKSETNIENKE